MSMQPEWRVESAPILYPDAIQKMEARVEAIRNHHESELIWLLEHPPIYTAGTSAVATDLIDPNRFPVFHTGRGGRYTYHGPGQRVGYVLLDLDRRGRDLRCFVDGLEQWVIASLRHFGLSAFQRPGRVGVWIDCPTGTAKIAAIGVRVRRWVTFHGFAINVSPDLSHFAGIVPCGLSEDPVTSLAAVGINATLADVDSALRDNLADFLNRLSCRKLSA